MRYGVAGWVLAAVFFFGFLPSVSWGEEGKISLVSHTALAQGDVLKIGDIADQPPTIFLIDGEKPRLVLDFVDTEYAGKTTSIKVPEGNLVKGIRVGIHHKPQKKVRLVADLKTSDRIHWEQSYEPESMTLTVMLSAGGKQKADLQPVAQKKIIPVEKSTDQPPATQLTATNSKGILKSENEEKEPAVQEEPIHAVTDKKDQKETTIAKTDTQTQDVEEVAPKQPVPMRSPVLRSVNFDNAFSQSGEMVLLQLSDFEPPEISTQEKDPPRIYCDFLGAEIAEGLAESFDAGGDYVKSIQVLKEDMRVRVVLDLIPGANYDLQQVYFKEDNLFVLIVNTMAEDGAK